MGVVQLFPVSLLVSTHSFIQQAHGRPGSGPSDTLIGAVGALRSAVAWTHPGQRGWPTADLPGQSWPSPQA